MNGAIALALPPTAIQRDPGRDQGRVPSEYLGRARALRREMLHTDQAVNHVVKHLQDPLAARLKRKGTLRPEHVVDAMQRWVQQMPAAYRLDRKIERQRHSVTLHELRAVGSTWQDQGWKLRAEDGPEPGVGLLLVQLTAGKRGLALAITPISTISLHAVARWYQRRPGRSTGDLMIDLATLAARVDMAGDAIPVPGGVWLGQDTWARDDTGRRVRIRSIRTFIDAGALP